MANTFDDLVPDAYVAVEKVARKQVGLVAAVTMNSSDAEAAIGDTIRAAFTPVPVINDNPTPSMTVPEGDDQVFTNKTFSLDKNKAIQIPWEGEESRSFMRNPEFRTTMGNQLVQAMAALTNEVEADLALKAYQGTSRALGVAGTTPFGSDYDILADAREVIEDNGIGYFNDMHMVISNAAAANLRKLGELSKVNEAGTTAMLRQGLIDDLTGWMIKQSGQIQTHSVGSVTATFETDGAHAVGATSIAVTTDGTGAATLTAGDIVTFAGDSNEYVVASALTLGNSASGTLVIQEPGLQVAAADNTAIAAEDTNFAGLVGIHRPSFELAMRAPAMPEGGDVARNSTVIQDPYSGLVFRLSEYAGYRKRMLEVSVVWGAKVWQPEYNVLIRG